MLVVDTILEVALQDENVITDIDDLTTIADLIAKLGEQFVTEVTWLLIECLSRMCFYNDVPNERTLPRIP